MSKPLQISTSEVNSFVFKFSLDLAVDGMFVDPRRAAAGSCKFKPSTLETGDLQKWFFNETIWEIWTVIDNKLLLTKWNNPDESISVGNSKKTKSIKEDEGKFEKPWKTFW